MKICPTCNTNYEDDNLEKCPKDNAVLNLVEPQNVSLPLSTPSVLPEENSAPTEATTEDLEPETAQYKPEHQPQAPKQRTEPAIFIAEPQKNSSFHAQSFLKNRWLLIGPPLFVIILGILVGIYFWVSYHSSAEVHLNSNPVGAQVILDGKKVGTAPLLIRLKKGTHQVTFELPGYEITTEDIEVIDNHHVLIKKMVPILKSAP